MDFVGFVKVMLVAFVTLFPLVNPIGDAPISSLSRSSIQSLPNGFWHARLQLMVSCCLPFLFCSAVSFWTSLVSVCSWSRSQLGLSSLPLAGVCSIKRIKILPETNRREHWRMPLSTLYFHCHHSRGAPETSGGPRLGTSLSAPFHRSTARHVFSLRVGYDLLRKR